MPKVDGVDEFGMPIEDDEDGDEGSDGEGLKSLRAALKKAQRTIKEQGEQITQFQSEKATTSLKDLLGKKELSPRLAKWIKADAGDKEINEEFLDGWIRENGEDFGIQVEKPQDNIEPEAREAQERISAAASRGTGVKPVDFEEAHRQMTELDSNDPQYLEKRDAIYKAINPSA